MSDLISRQSAIEAVHQEFDECLVWDESGQTTADEVERILDYLPTIDAVPVVRCGNCAKRGKNGKCWKTLFTCVSFTLESKNPAPVVSNQMLPQAATIDAVPSARSARWGRCQCAKAH